MFLCFLLVFTVSFIAIKAAKNNRIENAMETDLQQLTEKIDESYYALVQMSQQMTATGNVGKSVNAYFSSSTPYERIEASSNVKSNMNIMVFSRENISLVSYLFLEEDMTPGKTIFATLPLKDGTDPSRLNFLMRTQELNLNAMHSSLNSFSNRDAVSLTRGVRFSRGEEYLIYAELFSSTNKDLQRLSESRDVPYVFLQTDETRRICYSSNESFAVGTTLEHMSGGDGIVEFGGYTYLRGRSKFGFYNVLALPKVAYDRQMLNWMLSVGSVFVASLVLVIFSGVLLFRFIYRPMQILGQDMGEAGQGNLVPSCRSFHIDEFDQLFFQFEEMKRRIVSLMEDVRMQENEKQQLEIDKLYYQINPHFLMNALNSVHWMAVTRGQPEIERFVYQLNYLLSYSLSKTDRRSTLRTELKSLELYLALQQERYDFAVQLDVEKGDYLDYPSARLILQPLAENAVCHNMSDFGNLWVSVKREGEFVRITMKDDGCGFVTGEGDGDLSQSQINKGIGLRYVRMSLASFYGEGARLLIESEPELGTTITLLLPSVKGG
jgi:two-component system sensor histidine kinase YesM